MYTHSCYIITYLHTKSTQFEKKGRPGLIESVHESY